MGIIGSALRRVERDGLLRTAADTPAWLRTRSRAWRDDARDWMDGIDTRGIIEPSDLDHVGEHAAQSTGHEPIQRESFEEMMRAVRIDYPRFTFMDLGSGKGRALLLAAGHPFRRVIGVEFSPTLHRAAERNVDRFRALHPDAASIELRCEDAAGTALPDTPLVCFLYNPFGEGVLRKVVARLETFESDLRVFYRNPVCASVLDVAPFLELQLATSEFRVYARRPT